MGILLCEQNFREVWRRNENVRAEIGQILHKHTRGSISSKDIYIIIIIIIIIMLYFRPIWPIGKHVYTIVH